MIDWLIDWESGRCWVAQRPNSLMEGSYVPFCPLPFCLDKRTKVVYINDVSCDKCRGYQYRSARITGEFIGINMNCITDTITTIESIFQMHRTAKKPKIFSVPFQNFWEKGQSDKKGPESFHNCPNFLVLYVPFCPFLSLFQLIFIIFFCLF